MHIWYVDVGIEDTPEPVYTLCLLLSCSFRSAAPSSKYVLKLVN